MAIDPTVKSDDFLPNHESDSYGAWCGGCQGPNCSDIINIDCKEIV